VLVNFQLKKGVVVALSLACVSFYCYFLVSAALRGVPFFGDGAMGLYRILDTSGFSYTPWANRHYADYVVQFPVVFLIRLGIDDLSLLRFVFNFSYMMLPLLGFVISWVPLRKKYSRYYFYPVLSYFLFSIIATFSIFSEGHFLYFLLWPVFLYIFIRDEFERFDYVLLVLFSFLLLKIYQTVVLFAPLFLIGSVWRGRRSVDSVRYYWYVLAFWFVVVFGFNGWMLFNLRNSQQAGFMRNVLTSLEVLPIYFSLFSFLIVSAFLFVSTTRLIFLSSSVRKFAVFSLFGFLLAASVVYLADRPVDTFEGWANRVYLSGGLFGVFVFVLMNRFLPDWFDVSRTRMAPLFMLIFMIAVPQITRQIYLAGAWGRIAARVREVAESGHGLVYYNYRRDIQSAKNVIMHRISWNLTPLSIVVRDTKKIQAILLDNSLRNDYPLDPVHSEKLFLPFFHPAESRYFDFDPFFVEEVKKGRANADHR